MDEKTVKAVENVLEHFGAYVDWKKVVELRDHEISQLRMALAKQIIVNEQLFSSLQKVRGIERG